MVTLRTLTGTHLTPLSQNVRWQSGDFFTPIDAIGQWFNQGMSRNLQNLRRELISWLKSHVSFLINQPFNCIYCCNEWH